MKSLQVLIRLCDDSCERAHMWTQRYIHDTHKTTRHPHAAQHEEETCQRPLRAAGLTLISQAHRTRIVCYCRRRCRRRHSLNKINCATRDKCVRGFLRLSTTLPAIPSTISHPCAPSYPVVMDEWLRTLFRTETTLLVTLADVRHNSHVPMVAACAP